MGATAMSRQWGQLVVAVAIVVANAGCVSLGGLRLDLSQPTVDHTPRHVIFFLDGAGGGGPIIDCGPVVEEGLRQGGFTGEFRSFRWHTGFGAVADEISSMAYKRGKARKLARQISDLRANNPTGRIDVVSASAGTSVAVFALEELPDNVAVDHLVMLSSALSARYDLTWAMKHVRDRAFTFSSDGDELLRALIPVLGSADREYVGTAVAGLIGFAMPEKPSGDTHYHYSRLERIEWSSDMIDFDHRGGHTDYKNARFIANVIAPRLGLGSARQVAAGRN